MSGIVQGVEYAVHPPGLCRVHWHNIVYPKGPNLQKIKHPDLYLTYLGYPVFNIG